MHQIKLFKGVENEISQLETDINAWLAETGVNVVEMSGNISPQTPGREAGSSTRFAPSDILVAIHYTTG